MSRYHIALRDMHAKYGPLVREQRGDHALIHVFDPDDVKAVFSVEGKSPTIPPLQVTWLFIMYKMRIFKQCFFSCGLLRFLYCKGIYARNKRNSRCKKLRHPAKLRMKYSGGS